MTSARATTLRWLAITGIVLAAMFLLSSSSLRRLPLPSTLRYSTMSATNVMITFKKTASDTDKNDIIQDIKAKGGKVVKDDNLKSTLYPYVVVSVKPGDFAGLKQNLGEGHAVVDNVEEDKEFTTQ